MSFTVGIAIALLLAAPPVIWVGWWLISDIGQAGSTAPIRRPRAT